MVLSEKQQQPKLIERLKFYCDTDKEKNKFMVWTVNNIFDLEGRLLYWMKLVTIRAAWYEVIEDGKCTQNERIDLNRFTNHNFQNVQFKTQS